MALQENSPTKVDELCGVFAETMNSISEDCAILRQLASLQLTTLDHDHAKSRAQSQPQSKEAMHGPVDENTNPNTAGSPSETATATQNLLVQQNMVQQLNGLDSILAQLETKVSTIQSVLKEEQQSMDILEQTKISALGQAKVIREIRQGMEDQELNDLLPGNGLLKMGFQLDTLGVNSHKKRGMDIKKSNAIPQARYQSGEASSTFQSSSSSSSSSNRSKPLSTPKPIKSSTMAKTPHTASNTNTNIPIPSIALCPITQTEFQQISKNIRGRITLSAVNEALADIQNVTQYKYTILSSRKTPRPSRSTNTNTAPSMSTSMQYQQTVARHKELRSEDHDGGPFVSEQEMRDSCAFFRSGESTARAILLILRSAKRIKQVFGRKSQVTYVWLNKEK